MPTTSQVLFDLSRAAQVRVGFFAPPLERVAASDGHPLPKRSRVALYDRKRAVAVCLCLPAPNKAPFRSHRTLRKPQSPSAERRAHADVYSFDAGQVIGMVLHELATNAAKYGARSNKDGHVWVCWRWQQNGQGENQLRIEWQERGGPLVDPQSRCGYGTRVIRDLIPHELGGTVELVHSCEWRAW